MKKMAINKMQKVNGGRILTPPQKIGSNSGNCVDRTRSSGGGAAAASILCLLKQFGSQIGAYK